MIPSPSLALNPACQTSCPSNLALEASLLVSSAMIELKRNKVFELLGAVPTNPRWSWSALTPDHKLAVFTLWEDQELNRRNPLTWDRLHDSSNNGENDQRRNLKLVMEKDIPAYGLVCTARDPSAMPRGIKSVRADYMIRLEIVQEGEDFWGVHKQKVLIADLVKNTVRLKHLRSNGLNDLLSPPEGAEEPDRALTVGFTVKRDDKVRSHVIQRANGRCEFCGEEGFQMPDGRRYLEAHHIIFLANAGSDTVENVIALCPSHHREAHYGINGESLEEQFLEIVKRKQ